MTNRERFIEIFKTKIKREGSEKLLQFLCSEQSDFFTAPASTRFHGNYEGGLLEHSLNVYDCLCDIMKRPRIKEQYGIEYSEESIAIAALLHDLCKVNFYKTSFRNQKNPEGKWESVPYYTIEDNEKRRALIEANYKRAISEGDKNVYFVDGSKMFPEALRDDCTCDGCHPNDLGYHYMANAFEKVIRPILEK